MPVRGERVHPLDSTADVLSVENPSGLASPLQEPSHGEMAGVGALEGGERSPDSVEAEEAKGSGGESQVHDVEFMSAKMFGDKAELMTDRQKNILKMQMIQHQSMKAAQAALEAEMLDRAPSTHSDNSVHLARTVSANAWMEAGWGQGDIVDDDGAEKLTAKEAMLSRSAASRSRIEMMKGQRTTLSEKLSHAAEQISEPLLDGFDYVVDEVEIWVARLARRMPREMYGHSFDALDSKNMLRTASFYILAAPGFKLATLAITVAWSIIIPYQTQSREQEISFHQLNIAATLLLTAEVLMKCLAFTAGAPFPPKDPVHRSFSFFWSAKDRIFNRVDFLVLISAWLEIAMTIRYGVGVPQQRILVLRPLRLFKVFHAIYSALGMSWLDGFYSCFRELRVYLFAGLLLLLSTLLGTSAVYQHMYAGAYSRRCVSPGTGEAMIPETWCAANKASSPGQNSCPAPFVCRVVGNPGWGYAHFDHLGGTILLASSILSLDAQWVHLSRTLAADPEWWWSTMLVFLSAAVLGSFLCLNMFVALVAAVFSESLELDEARAVRGRPPPPPSSTGSEAVVVQPAVQIETLPAGSRAVYTSRDVARAFLASLEYRMCSSILIIFDAALRLSWHFEVQGAVSLAIEWTEVATTVLFVLEMAVKVYSSGTLARFYEDYRVWGAIELCIITLSATSLAVSRTGLNTDYTHIFRHAVMLRITHVLYELSWTRAVLIMGERVLFKATATALWLAFCVAVWGLIAHRVIHDSLEGLPAVGEDGVSPARASFRSFAWSAISILRVQSGDGLASVVEDSMHAVQLETGAPYAGVVGALLGLWFWLSRYTFHGMFMGVVLSQFSVHSWRKASGQGKEVGIIASGSVGEANAEEKDEEDDEDEGEDGEVAGGAGKQMDSGGVASSPNIHADDSMISISGGSKVNGSEGEGRGGAGEDGVELWHSFDEERRQNENVSVSGEGGESSSSLSDSKPDKVRGPAGQNDKKPYTLSRFKRDCARLKENPVYEVFCLAAVIVSCALVGRRPWLAPGTQPPSIAELSVLAVTSFAILIEISVSLASKLSIAHFPYVRVGPFDVLDIAVLAASLGDFAGFYGSATKPLRLYRVLSSFLVHQLIPTLPVVLRGARAALPPLACTIAAWMIICFVFAAISVRIFGGGLHSCADTSATGKQGCVGEMLPRLEGANSTVSHDFPLGSAFWRPRTWDSTGVSFDSFYTAMIALLAGSTFEWSHWAKAASETAGAYSQPRPDASLDSLSAFIFFVPLVWACIYGCMSAVVVSGEAAALSDEERRERAYSLMLTHIAVESPWKDLTRDDFAANSVVALSLRMHLQSPRFNAFLEGCNLLTCLVALLYNTQMEATLVSAYRAQAVGFAVILAAELLMHLIAYGLGRVVSTPKTVLMLLAIIATFMGASGAGELESNSPMQALGMALLFRVPRAVLTVLTFLLPRPFFRCTRTAVTLALPRIVAVTVVGVVAWGGAVCIAVQAFGTVKMGRFIGTAGDFSTFPRAATTVLMVAMGAPWTVLMDDCGIEPPSCSYALGDCGSVSGSPAFFILVKFATQLLLLNMYLAATFEAFLEAWAIETGPLGRGVLGEIRRMWEELDHRKSLSLPTYVIEDLLARVPEPIGCWWLREPAGTNDGSVRSVSKGGGGEENQPWISEPMLWKMELIAELEVISGTRATREEFFSLARRGNGESAMVLSMMNERRLPREEAEQVADRWRGSLRRGSIGAITGSAAQTRTAQVLRRAKESRKARQRKEREEREKMTLSDKYLAVRLLAYFLSPWTERSGWWIDRSRMDSSYPDLGGRGAMSVISGEKIKYQDLVLALVHIHVPGCQPAKLKSRRSEVMAVVGRRVAAARIIAFLRRREEWRKTWGNPLALIREEIKKVHEEEERQRIQDELAALQLEEEERQRVERERLEYLSFIPHHSLPQWAEYAVSLAPAQVPADIIRYFSRCVYYIIRVPFTPTTLGSPLYPTVNDPRLEKYGYAPQASASIYRTVAIPIAPDEGVGEGSELGYNPPGLASATSKLIAEDICKYLSYTVGEHRTETRWKDAVARMVEFRSLGNHDGFELKLTWPGSVVGLAEMGLAEANASADGWCSIRVLSGLHSFYTAASRRSEASECFELREATPNLMALMGINRGSCTYNCHLLTGYQGCVVLGGGAISATGHAVPHPEAQSEVRHSEGSLVGVDAFEASMSEAIKAVEDEVGMRVLARSRPNTRGSGGGRPRTSNTERSVQRRYDEEFIKSYAREYYKRRTVIMALVVLQAKARGKVARLIYAADRKRQAYLGQTAATGINIDTFLRKKKRRELSLAMLSQTADDTAGGRGGGEASVSPQRTAWMVGGMSSLLKAGADEGGGAAHEKRMQQRLMETARFTAGRGASRGGRAGGKAGVDAGAVDMAKTAEDYIR